MPGAFLEDEEEDEEEDELQRAMRFARHRGANIGYGEENMTDYPMTDEALDFEDVKGRLSQWI